MYFKTDNRETVKKNARIFALKLVAQWTKLWNFSKIVEIGEIHINSFTFQGILGPEFRENPLSRNKSEFLKKKVSKIQF